MKHVRTTHDIDAPAETVWAILMDFPSHAEWNPLFASLEGTPLVGESLKFVVRNDGGTGMTFRPKVLDMKPGELLRWKGKLMVPGLFDGTHEFRLERLDAGRTRLHHNEDFHGLLVPLMGKVVADTERGFEAFNRALAERAEALEIVSD